MAMQDSKAQLNPSAEAWPADTAIKAVIFIKEQREKVYSGVKLLAI